MIKKSKLLEAIDPCTKFFQFFGYAVFILPKKSSSFRTKIKAFLILVKYFLLIGILGYFFVDAIMHRLHRLRDSHGLAIHVIFFVSLTSQGLIALIFSLLKSSELEMYLKTIKKVDELLINVLSVKVKYYDLRWNLLISTWFCVLLQLFGNVTSVVLAVRKSSNLWRLGIYFTVPFFLSQVFVQRFIFTVQLLTFYLDTLVEELERIINNQPLLVRPNEIASWSWNTKKNRFKLKTMQKAHRMLWEASNLVNRSFSIGLLNVFFIHLLSLIYRGYTLSIDVLKHEATNRQFISMSTTLFEVYLVHFYCQKCLNSVSIDPSTITQRPTESQLMEFLGEEIKVFNS